MRHPNPPTENAPPLATICRKLVYRRCAGVLRSRQGRQRAVLGLVATAFIMLVLLSAIQLPDADDEAHAHKLLRRMALKSSAAPLKPSSSPSPHAVAVSPSLGMPDADLLSPPPPPSPSEGAGAPNKDYGAVWWDRIV